MEPTRAETEGKLNREMARAREGMLAQMPPEVVDKMARSGRALAASGLAERAVGVGDTAPDFALPAARGGTVRLSELLSRGPVVVSFFRGGWCPYCTLEAGALKRAVPEIERLGASLVAIAPQTEEANRETDAGWSPGFPLLADAGGGVAARYGLLYPLDDTLREVYRGFGVDLEKANGNDRWELPIPATYVVGTDGTVRAAYVHTDYTTRMEPAAILAALSGPHGGLR